MDFCPFDHLQYHEYRFNSRKIYQKAVFDREPPVDSEFVIQYYSGSYRKWNMQLAESRRLIFRTRSWGSFPGTERSKVRMVRLSQWLRVLNLRVKSPNNLCNLLVERVCLCRSTMLFYRIFRIIPFCQSSSMFM
ncbi:hypothetical protein V565_209260 [Rhizoctonia solani 123E]|uniref:Uncharacterized protein n=1 Tax=Rhizoctonia solani 123E TaxID=1423351 RepID=A0A074RHN7_9AGAM|nr:hypothetical protein V565_209260 [Rhizoctonia solani 123E]